MAVISPLKQFKFTIEIDGLDQFLCQEVTLPDQIVEEVEHTEGNFKVRTPGLVTLGDITLSKLKPADTADDWALEWITSVQDLSTGVGGVPADYLRTVVIRLQDNAGNTIETRTYTDCWVKQNTGLTLSKTSSDNIMQEVVIVANGLG